MARCEGAGILVSVLMMNFIMSERNMVVKLSQRCRDNCKKSLENRNITRYEKSNCNYHVGGGDAAGDGVR